MVEREGEPLAATVLGDQRAKVIVEMLEEQLDAHRFLLDPDDGMATIILREESMGVN